MTDFPFVMSGRPRSPFTAVAASSRSSLLSRPGPGLHAEGIRPGMWPAAVLVNADRAATRGSMRPVSHSAPRRSGVDWSRLRRTSHVA